MKILLGYSATHFDPQKPPAVQKYWGHSASILARTLYRVLQEFGEVTYLDNDSYSSVAGQSFDLFVGIAANFDRVLASCSIKKSIFVAVNMHPAERNRMLRSFMRREGVPRRALSHCDLAEVRRTCTGLRQADAIVCVGGTLAYNSYLRHGIPPQKIFMLNYGLPKAEAEPTARQAGQCSSGGATRRFVYSASDIGLRKGFDVVAALFSHRNISGRDFRLDIVGAVMRPYYKEKLAKLVKISEGKVVYHGWQDSHESRYREILNDADYVFFPSIEEGQAGTAIDAIARGVIPIVSAESGIDFSPLGMLEPKIHSDRNLETLECALDADSEKIDDLRRRTIEYYDEFHAGWDDRLATALRRFVESGTLYPKVSLVLSIFNKEKTIVPIVWLLHAAATRYGNAEFEIIFDGCKDRSETLVRDFFVRRSNVPAHFYVTPDIFEVRSNNIGLRHARGDYAAIIQDDNTVRDVGFIFEAVHFLEKNPKAAILGGLAGVNFYPRGTTGLAGSGQIQVSENEVYWRQDASTNPALRNRTFEVDACMRGPLFLRKSFLDAHGYLDEAYAPLYQDDMDIAFRARHSGFKTYCVLMDATNDSATMRAYDADRWNRFTKVVKRNTDLFYQRWEPTFDKSGYTWIHRTRMLGSDKTPALDAAALRLGRLIALLVDRCLEAGRKVRARASRRDDEVDGFTAHDASR